MTKSTGNVDLERGAADLYFDYVTPLDEAFAHFYGLLTAIRPTHLHHYTSSADAVIAIVETGKLWATNARFLNDSSEVGYGTEVVADTLRSRMKRANRLLKPIPGGSRRKLSAFDRLFGFLCRVFLRGC